MKIIYDYFIDEQLGNLYFALLEDTVIWVHFNSGYSAEVLEKDLVRYLKEPISLQYHPQPELVRQFKSYLAGDLKEFPMAFKVINATDFQQAVYKACCEVGYGETRTYGELAKMLDKPKAARAVGQALRRNPIPLLVPCHRVIGADASLRGYGGKKGVGTKAWLLTLEGVMIAPHKVKEESPRLF